MLIRIIPNRKGCFVSIYGGIEGGELKGLLPGGLACAAVCDRCRANPVVGQGARKPCRVREVRLGGETAPK